MSSKQEIKDLFTAELLNSPQYQILLDIKKIILDEIATPNIQAQLIYNFPTPQSEYDLEVIKMCMMLVFGFSTNNLSKSGIIIEMADFLK
jgi:hypothetical protein